MFQTPHKTDIVTPWLQVTLRRPLLDVAKQVPLYELAISLPSIKATLSDQEYQLMTSVAGANLAELFRIPEPVLVLQRRHLPATGAAIGNRSDSEDSGSDDDQVLLLYEEIVSRNIEISRGFYEAQSSDTDMRMLLATEFTALESQCLSSFDDCVRHVCLCRREL